MWDPRTWRTDDHEYRIYSSWDIEGVYAIVDAIDYPYLSQYLWSIHDPKKINHPYLRRSVHIELAPEGAPYESRITGKIVRNRYRVQRNEFLHQAVMRLKGDEPPTPEHTTIDHRDRNTLNCRRANLVWATKKEQVLNARRRINGVSVLYSESVTGRIVQDQGGD
jgi:hypothetical protein